MMSPWREQRLLEYDGSSYSDYWIREEVMGKGMINLVLGSSYAGTDHIIIYCLPRHLMNIACQKLLTACKPLDEQIEKWPELYNDGYEGIETKNGRDVLALTEIEGQTFLIEFLGGTTVLEGFLVR